MGSDRRRRVGTVLAVVVLLVTAGVATYLVLLQRTSSRPVTVDEAREQADAAGQGTASTDSGVPFRPPAGIYEYRGEGTERLDRPPTSQDQGPDIPGTVTHLDDRCWRFRVDYNTNHWQSWDYCSTGDGLTERAGEFFQRLDLVVTEVDTTSSFTCDPPVDVIRPDQRAGDEWTHECRGSSSGAEGEVTTAGPYTFVGPETLEIGREQVEALHYRRTRNLSGAQSGVELIDVWFQADSGLVLQNERTIEVRSNSLVGVVTYREEGRFTLGSTTPAA